LNVSCDEDALKPQLLRRLKTADLALVTVGSIVGSGIFRTPAVVAQRAHAPGIILGCWIAGGAIAVTGAFVYAELAARRPLDGGLLGYLRDAYHPVVAFLFGWTLLLISGTGPNAAAAVLFAGYLGPLTGVTLNPRIVAALTIAVLAIINLLGVRQGGNWQNFVSALKIGAVGVLIVACLFAHAPAIVQTPTQPFAQPASLLGAIGVAMLPILFTYAGFQNTAYVTAETVHPNQTIPRAILTGVGIVVALYVLANVGYLRTLGAAGLAASTAPAADAMRAAIGNAGSRFVALAIALSTLGYLSTAMLVMPRVYYHMAAEGSFFKGVAWISPRTNVPAVAILLHALIASFFAVSGTYEQIINWVVAPQWLFIALGAGALFIFRRQDAASAKPAVSVPGHPVTTALFLAVLAGIFVAELTTYPRDTAFGIGVLVAGYTVYRLRGVLGRLFV
jgi:APA family basic amino acid/polyamine antiporter